MAIDQMGFFEWSVIALLALIWLRRDNPDYGRTAKVIRDSLVQIEALLASIATNADGIAASTSSSSDDIREMRIASLPQYDPNVP